MSNRIIPDNSSNSWIDKKISLYEKSDFLEPTHTKNEIKIDLDLSNYATKSDLKNATSVRSSKFAKAAYLASLKSEIFKLDIDKLETTLVDLSKRID